ncbi:MAG: endonuclease MutS2, partial [Dehalococcoidia bacterium]
MDEHTLRVLEFDKVIARLAENTSFSAGRELALALQPSTDRDEVVRRQRITSEARRLRDIQPRVGLGGAHEVRPQADKAARGGVLLTAELLDVAATLESAGNLRGTIRRVADELPMLAGIADGIEPLPELVAEINRSIDQRGEVTDAASPALASLRRNVRVSHDRLNDRLQSLLNSPQYRDAIQEPIITQRDGRYVIPVKAEQRGQLRGIVHDVSSSGATVFLEPLALVELGNTWRELQLEEEREVERVLRELSGLAGASADGIIDSVAALAELDLALAKARLGDDMQSPELPHEGAEQAWIVEPGGQLHLLNARHPGLLLRKTSTPALEQPSEPRAEVVPITVTVGGEYTALLVTGPNTGGKTVALKT